MKTAIDISQWLQGAGLLLAAVLYPVAFVVLAAWWARGWRRK